MWAFFITLKANHMFITKQSDLTGITHTMEISVTPAQIKMWYAKGTHIQYEFPFLTAVEREFLLTGITEEEWQNAFGQEEDD